jgi:hypothetical protein
MKGASHHSDAAAKTMSRSPAGPRVTHSRCDRSWERQRARQPSHIPRGSPLVSRVRASAVGTILKAMPMIHSRAWPRNRTTVCRNPRRDPQPLGTPPVRSAVRRGDPSASGLSHRTGEGAKRCEEPFLATGPVGWFSRPPATRRSTERSSPYCSTRCRPGNPTCTACLTTSARCSRGVPLASPEAGSREEDVGGQPGDDRDDAKEHERGQEAQSQRGDDLHADTTRGGDGCHPGGRP